MRARAFLLIALMALSGCMTSTQRNIRDFVQRDALGEAEDTARERCNGGPYRLFPGRKGYSVDDYACVPVTKP